MELAPGRIYPHLSGAKVQAFKRCCLLRRELPAEAVQLLHALVAKEAPSKLCYIHLVQCGGRAAEVAGSACAFGCRDWEWAAVVTGCWPVVPRDEGGSGPAHVNDPGLSEAAARTWVYHAVQQLLRHSDGVYSADLGPSEADARLAVHAFGANLPRLAALKAGLDPHYVLACACPITAASRSIPEGSSLVDYGGSIPAIASPGHPVVPPSPDSPAPPGEQADPQTGRREGPKCIVLMCGRRCSGKDFAAQASV